MKIYPTKSFSFITLLSKDQIYERLWSNSRSKFDVTQVFFCKSAALELGHQYLRDSLSLDLFPAKNVSPVQKYKCELSSVDVLTSVTIESSMGMQQKLSIILYSLFTGFCSMLAIGTLILSPDWTMNEFPIFVLFIPFVMFVFGHILLGINLAGRLILP